MASVAVAESVERGGDEEIRIPVEESDDEYAARFERRSIEGVSVLVARDERTRLSGVPQGGREISDDDLPF